MSDKMEMMAAAPSQQMYTVTVPQGVGPGGQVPVEFPTGTAMVVVPAGHAPGSTFQVAVAGEATPLNTAQDDGGLGFLNRVGGLFIQRQVELLEECTGCETKNKYRVAIIPDNGLPQPIPDDWVSRFRDSAECNPLLTAKEDSECCERICCPMFRSFTMPFVLAAQGGATAFTLERPYHCTCWSPCCKCGGAQEMMLVDRSGTTVAHAREEWMCGWWCARTFQAMDGQGTVLYNLRASECSTIQGHNCWAPSCLNEAYKIDIYAADNETVVGEARFVWPGCNCAGLTDASNIVLRFPEGSNQEQRVALLNGIMLIEFACMEWKQQEGGGGGG